MEAYQDLNVGPKIKKKLEKYFITFSTSQVFLSI